jgi:glucose/arabinose dehydrogenase
MDGVASRHVFAEGLAQPFGIAFLGSFVYVANTNELVRFGYDPRTAMRLGSAEHVIDLPGLGYRQHWTRSVALDPDAKQVFISVGSASNVFVESDVRRGAILVCDPHGGNARVYASGLRNAVGIALNPQDGRLWAAVNERDDLGDDVPDDFFTHVVDGGFYGWPYSYLGSHQDNRVRVRPDMAAKAIPPDVLLGAHVAPLQVAFYEGDQFPNRYKNGAFIAEHGSWNRRIRAGYDVVFVPFKNGNPSGPPEPFLTGFVPDPAGKAVYARPVGVAAAPDGSLFVSDDGGNVIWRVSFEGTRY